MSEICWKSNSRAQRGWNLWQTMYSSTLPFTSRIMPILTQAQLQSSCLKVALEAFNLTTCISSLAKLRIWSIALKTSLSLIRTSRFQMALLWSSRKSMRCLKTSHKKAWITSSALVRPSLNIIKSQWRIFMLTRSELKLLLQKCLFK